MSPRQKQIRALLAKGYGVRKIARQLNIGRTTIYEHLRRAPELRAARSQAGGRLHTRSVRTYPKPPKDKIARYILTSAQNNTYLWPGWDNLLALAKHYDAKVLVSRFTYNKNAFGRLSVKPGTAEHYDNLWYDPRIAPYICDEQVEVAPGLVFCGEMNIMPTAARPISGLEVYTGRKSTIIPHAKVAMQSIPSMKGEPTKFIYTTGTVTKRNYIQKKEGLRAEFHHVYGAVLVEVDSDGRWWVRQLNADKQNRIYDLTFCAADGKVTGGHRAEAINWGDVHHAQIDPTVARLAWAKGGMLDTLKAKYQFFHDLLDGRARNPHNLRKDAFHERFRDYVKGHDSVEKEIKGVTDFLYDTQRPFCKSIVVASNHHDFVLDWLRQGDYKVDPVNAEFFLRAQNHVFSHIRRFPDRPVNILRWAASHHTRGRKLPARFLDEDESFTICKTIECGMHGDLGANGARGSPAGFARMGRRANTGHTHSAGIVDGIYTAGLSGQMDQGYNRGPGSWSHSHILTYPNGKRTIITMFEGKWRA